MSRRTSTAALAAAALALGTLAAIGGAAPAAATPPAYGHLVLNVYDGYETGGELLGSAELWCDPDIGSHPDPVAACTELELADGDLARLAGEPGPCPPMWAPVTATAEGYWQGGVQPVDFRHTYANKCDLYRATTPVFDILDDD